MSNYECSLQGVVIGKEQKDKLIQRLVGICGNDSTVDLYEHEIIFTPSSICCISFTTIEAFG